MNPDNHYSFESVESERPSVANRTPLIAVRQAAARTNPQVAQKLDNRIQNRGHDYYYRDATNPKLYSGANSDLKDYLRTKQKAELMEKAGQTDSPFYKKLAYKIFEHEEGDFGRTHPIEKVKANRIINNKFIGKIPAIGGALAGASFLANPTVGQAAEIGAGFTPAAPIAEWLNPRVVNDVDEEALVNRGYSGNW